MQRNCTRFLRYFIKSFLFLHLHLEATNHGTVIGVVPPSPLAYWNSFEFSCYKRTVKTEGKKLNRIIVPPTYRLRPDSSRARHAGHRLCPSTRADAVGPLAWQFRRGLLRLRGAPCRILASFGGLSGERGRSGVRGVGQR